MDRYSRHESAEWSRGKAKEEYKTGADEGSGVEKISTFPPPQANLRGRRGIAVRTRTRRLPFTRLLARAIVQSQFSNEEGGGESDRVRTGQNARTSTESTTSLTKTLIKPGTSRST